MPLLRDAIRWFFPKRSFKPALRTIISPYDLREANEEQKLLMLYGAARSPEDATWLMKRLGVKSAHEALALLPPRKRVTFKHRLILLIRRFEGHDNRDIYGSAADDRISVRYRYRIDK